MKYEEATLMPLYCGSGIEDGSGRTSPCWVLVFTMNASIIEFWPRIITLYMLLQFYLVLTAKHWGLI